MSDICLQMKKQYEELKRLREEFDLIYGKMDKDNIDQAMELKEEIKKIVKELKEKIVPEIFRDLIKIEKIKLKEFFGYDIDVPKIPKEITIERLEKWQKQGLELHYLPDINMTEDKDFPGWSKGKRPENLYQYIKNGKVDKDATNLPGKWVLIDVRAKPQYDDGNQMYDNDILGPVIKELREKGLIYDCKQKDSRAYISWDDLNKDEVKKAFAKVLDAKPENIRLPRAIEWNVLGNLHHGDWGKTNTWEWFEDKHGSGNRLFGGLSDYGGLMCVDSDSSGFGSDDLGFRPLVCFS